MKKIQDKETRYYLDLDLKTGEIISWNYDQRQGLAQNLENPFSHRIFLTKGQYNKLEKKNRIVLEILKGRK